MNVIVSKNPDKIIVAQTKTSQTISDLIKMAETNHGFICLTNYESENGRRANYCLQPYGSNAYGRLVAESLRQLEDGKIESPKVLFDTVITEETWKEAVEEQAASFRKTLEEGHGRKNKKIKIDKGFYQINGVPCVFNVRLVRSFCTPEQEEHNVSFAKPKKAPQSPKAMAKAYIRKNVALGKYKGQFTLDPNKFDRIAFSNRVIEVAEFGQLFTP